ncbi:MAG: ion transporter, partial [Gemmatimonadales bacterium]|nr:ion transporter [Gemmatimonadales bacterium]
MDQLAREQRVRPYHIFMLALSLYAITALSVEVLVPLESETRRLLQAADTGVCLLFFFDFVYQFIRAPSKWRYFSRWGWIDLLSSIPMIDALRIGRLARVMRIMRVLRGVRSTKLLVTFILERRAESAVLASHSQPYCWSCSPALQ